MEKKKIISYSLLQFIRIEVASEFAEIYFSYNLRLAI